MYFFKFFFGDLRDISSLEKFFKVSYCDPVFGRILAGPVRAFPIEFPEVTSETQRLLLEGLGLISCHTLFH